MQPMKDTLIDGRYLLLDTLGIGGEAHVFRSKDTFTGNNVAVRLALSPVTYAAPSVLPFFHANWVQFLFWGVDAQYGAYQIFEVVEGQTLSQVVRYGPFNTDSWRMFVQQSLDAVTALHASGWVHGDLNGDNFVLGGSYGFGWKLLELPFLRFNPPPGRTSLFGSIYTLPPEQLNGQPAGFSSDLYSLGCLYYYAACGEYPHTGATSQQIAIERLRFDPTPLNEKAPSLPEKWSSWVMTLLQRDPKNRFPSASAAYQMLGIA